MPPAGCWSKPPRAADRERLVTDPAIVQAPFGPEVDGRRLLGEAVGFGRALRASRLAIDLGAAVDFARALTLVDIGEREQVRAAGEAIFVRRRDDREIYDAVFDRWWRRRNSRLAGQFEPPPLPSPNAPDESESADGAAEPAAGSDSTDRPLDERGIPIPSDGDDSVED